MSKYILWAEDAIEEIRTSNMFKALKKIDASIGNGFIDIIKEANNRHSEAMYQKDIKIAKLEAKLEYLEAKHETTK